MLVSVPDGSDVFARAAEKGITSEHFASKADSAAVIAMIDDEILPDIVREANAIADKAAEPLDFPLDYSTVAARYPDKTNQQLAEMVGSANIPGWSGPTVVAYQDSKFHKGVLLMALSELEDRINSEDQFWIDSALRHKQEALDEWQKGFEYVNKIVMLIPAVETEQVKYGPQSSAVAVSAVW